MPGSGEHRFLLRMLQFIKSLVERSQSPKIASVEPGDGYRCYRWIFANRYVRFTRERPWVSDVRAAICRLHTRELWFLAHSCSVYTQGFSLDFGHRFALFASSCGSRGHLEIIQAVTPAVIRIMRSLADHRLICIQGSPYEWTSVSGGSPLILRHLALTPQGSTALTILNL